MAFTRDVLIEVAKRVTDITDFARAGIVCRAFKSVFTLENYSPLIDQVRKSVFKDHRGDGTRVSPPLLIFTESSEESSDIRGIFDPSTLEVYTVSLPELRGKNIVGSAARGWLVTTSKEGGFEASWRLFNPLTREEIKLPPLPTENIYNMTALKSLTARVFLFPLPNSQGFSYTAVAFYGGCVQMAVFGRHGGGDHVWNEIHQCGFIMDLIVFNGNAFAVGSYGRLKLLDLTAASSSNPINNHIILGCIPSRALNISSRHCYLLELHGVILLIVRVLYEPDRQERRFSYRTKEFMVYRLDSWSIPERRGDSGTVRWVEIEDLGDYSLFLGRNTSFSFRVSSSETTARSTSGCCEKNCIYFTDNITPLTAARNFHINRAVVEYDQNYGVVEYDQGVYDMADRSFRPICQGKTASPPVWFAPAI